jgi:hypothetical protein
VGRALSIEFVISNLPASVKEDEKKPSLLSHFETSGQKSATEGLMVLRGKPK